MASFCSILIFIIIRTIHNFKQSIIWFFNGTALKIWQCRNNSFPFPQSAQLLDIRHHCRAFGTPSRRNFIMTHNSFVSPKYVVRKNVSLYCFETNLVVFIEWGGINGYYTSSLPKYGKRKALRMIVMSEEAYHELGDGLDDNKTSIRRIINTAHKAYKQCIKKAPTEKDSQDLEGVQTDFRS